MHPISRRTLLTAALAMPLLPAAKASATNVRAALPELVLWGPPAGPSVTLIHAIASGLTKPLADKVSFKSWRSPDELRAGLTSRTMQVFILPTQSAANLFNKGLGVRLLNVMTNGLLYMVAADPALSSIPSCKGRVVAVPYRNDTPEIIFRRLLSWHGLDGEKDLTLRYTGSPMEAVQLLATGRADAALLPEPAATAALLSSGKITRQLYRTMDIQQIWGQASGLGPVLPQAGLGVTEQFLNTHRDVVETLQAALERAAAAVNSDPARAAADASSEMWMPETVIAQSIPHSNLVATRAATTHPALEAMYKAVAEADPAIIGGTLPAPEFYL